MAKRGFDIMDFCDHVLDNGYCQNEKLDDDDPYCEIHMNMYSDEELQ
jgi:hypothetical protein